MNEKIMNEVKQKYDNSKNEFLSLIDKARASSVKTVISKGILQNVVLYENELNGDKIKGSIIAKIIYKDNCYRYSYDIEGKVVLVEQMSEFLKKFHYTTMYFYKDGVIKTLYFADDNLYNATYYILNNNMPVEVYRYASQGSSYTQYCYDNGKLIKSICMAKSEQYEETTELSFSYKDNAILQKIIKNWANGYSQTLYSCEKINYKKLEEHISNEIEKCFLNFSKEHTNEKISIIAFVCYLDDGYLSVSADIGECKYKSSLADWKYCDFCGIDLIDAPLDSGEIEKLLAAIAKAVDLASKRNAFINISKTDNFCFTMFNNDEEHIEKSNLKIKKLLSNNKYFTLIN